MPDPTSRLIVALDVPTLSEATELARRLAPHLAAVKIGSQLFTAEGPRAVHAMHDLGLRVFLDLKFHDIPNTVGGAVAAATSLGVWMLNVHASGGPAMLAAAAKEASATGVSGRTLVLGVTVLTSVEEKDLQATLGTVRTLRDHVLHLAREAKAAGLDGVVASPHEIADIRQACGPGFLIVTPGVRPAGAERGDQRRVMTPGEAIRAGADYVVVGRPILAAKDPVEAAERIAAECRAPSAERREP
ncbi:MAG: orotidine-5'-phosphate decarboxylase [candidate division NC10 bacterium]|nr:orotidine-5'-phosphate decarboxylase [candidate division NC10 bacterium]MBI2563577.1 orotidine-5'-phosphate decarboxylase [candidate division NC10 bacterium]